MFESISAIWSTPAIFAAVMLALAFDFSNGFHDAANSIATIVGTKVLKPWQAVLWASFWNFIAAWVFTVAIANTVAKWVIPAFVTPQVIIAGLIGAIVWNLATWWKGLPSSSSHALLGGFAGAAMTFAGSIEGVLKADKVIMIVIFIFIAPFVGLGLSFLISKVLRFFSPVDQGSTKTTKVIQLISSAAYSLGHGTNDAQKTMGIIAALLYSTVWSAQSVAFSEGKVSFPFWIIFICHLAMALGTLAGGWRIVNTLAFQVTQDLTNRNGACAEVAAAISLFGAAQLGVPVSTTHTITGALTGVGLEKGPANVYWQKLSEISLGWLVTIPAAGLMGAAAFKLVSLILI